MIGKNKCYKKVVLIWLKDKAFSNKSIILLAAIQSNIKEVEW